MEDLLDSVTRCPHCRAAVRPGAPWCTLCHTDLRPPPPTPEPPVLSVPPGASYGVPALDPLTAPAAALGLPGPAQPTSPSAEPSWPCSTCGASNGLSADACSACGAGFLSALRETEGPLLELPGVGDLTRMSRGQRMLIAFGVVLAFIALTAMLGLLVG